MNRLTDKAPYGQHVKLTCVNHPTMEWSTKNISPLGCRTIFYNLRSKPEMGAECNCSILSLIVVGPHDD